MRELEAAVVDTDVFSHIYVRSTSADPQVPGWRHLLAGRRVLISFQTRSEILAGALANNWVGRRMRQLRTVLDRTPTIRADNEVIESHAKLVVACRHAGHPLQDKQHTGDRWIAACAIAKDVELLAGDRIYARVRDSPFSGRVTECSVPPLEDLAASLAHTVRWGLTVRLPSRP